MFVMMIAMAVTVVVGVIFRWSGHALVWYDEVASVQLAWLTYYGSAYAALKGAHIGVPNIIKSLEGHVWSAFYRDVTKQNVELAHKHGLATCVWTVNREQDIIRMIEYGVDGIITDYPKKVQEICKSKNIAWF